MRMVSLCVHLLIFLLSGAAAFAETDRQSDIDIKLTQFRVIQKQGKENLVALDKAAPGDVIQYEATYQNTTQHVVHGLMAALPIPQNTQFVTNSASPADVLVSIDGKIFSRPPLQRKVINAKGEEEEQEVPVAEYRHLRWDLGELGAGKSVSVIARVRVDSSQ